jgi:putative ABC transport system permease protein
MTIRDIYEETTSALLSNKVRTGLTMLGIIIGIASVIAMLAVGNGATSSIQEKIQSIGSNLVVVSPGSQKSFSQVRNSRGSANTLTMADSEAIANDVTSAKAVAPSVSNKNKKLQQEQIRHFNYWNNTPLYTAYRNVEVDMEIFLQMSR